MTLMLGSLRRDINLKPALQSRLLWLDSKLPVLFTPWLMVDAKCLALRVNLYELRPQNDHTCLELFSPLCVIPGRHILIRLDIYK